MYFHVCDTNVRLLGSLHMFPSSEPAIPLWISEAYDWSDRIVFESDFANILPYFKAPASSNLQSILPPNVWAALESVWPSGGPLPLKSVQLWAAFLLGQAFCQQTSNGVEPSLIQWAEENSKPTAFLETAKEIASALESIPSEELQAGLRLLATDLAAPQLSLKNIHASWMTQDLEGIYVAAGRSPTFAYPGLRRALLEDRNRAWVPTIERYLHSNERTLIVVGALHLYGPSNLITLLDRPIERVQTS